MLAEVLAALRPESGGPFWDLTLGTGGHLTALLERAPEGSFALGLDGDPDALPRARARLGDRARLVHGDLGDLEAFTQGLDAPRAVLLDLGLSSPQVDDPGRGFSYRQDGPLDMRMDPTRGEPCSVFLEKVPQLELEGLLRDLGEERLAGRIARVIKESVPLETTLELAAAVERAVGRHRDGKHHPARRTFQALRIAVNDELGKAERALRWVAPRLAPGGRIACITFHSGEDRVVKEVFRELSQDGGPLEILTRRPLECSEAEARQNPRARSAKLRVAERRVVTEDDWPSWKKRRRQRFTLSDPEP